MEKIDLDNGFFYVPIPSNVQLASMMEKTKEFFNLPLSVKMKYPLDKRGLGYIPVSGDVNKESFTYRSGQISSGYEKEFDEYIENAAMFARSIFIYLMDKLGVSPEKYVHYIEPYSTNPSLRARTEVTLSIIHYPKTISSTAQIGFSPHTDWGFITLLYTDSDGLEIYTNDTWTKVPYRPDHYIVNIADMLEVLTAGKYKSVKHRVMNIDEKYSIALFFDPNPNSVICPCFRSDDYVPVKYDEYLERKLNVSYTDKI